MSDNLLLGLGRYTLPIPRPVWQRQIARNGEGNRASLGFMSPDHHRVRDFAVLELPRTGAPLPPALFADTLDLPLDRVVQILDDLEQHMTFLFRNAAGAVSWAYPVTVDPTQHRMRFSSGETLYAA
jgi:hypothetical protein